MKKIVYLMLFISFSATAQSKKKKVKDTPKAEPVFVETLSDTTEQFPQDTIQMVMQFSECAMCTVHPAIVYLIVENQGTKKKPEFVRKSLNWSNWEAIDENKIYIWNSQQVKKQ